MTLYVVASSNPRYRIAFDAIRESLPGSWLHVTDPRDLPVAAKLDPRYIFFPHWSHLVPKEILEFSECVCFHMTDLPYGRGGSPLQNLIQRGHKDTKLTAFRMINEVDAGPIYIKSDLSLEGSAQEIFGRAYALCVSMTRDIVMSWPEPVPQPKLGTSFKRRTPEQSRLPENAIELGDVYDHIRMLDADNYPKAFLDWGALRIHLDQAQPEGNALICRDSDHSGANVTVLVCVAHPDDDVLGCGGTILRHTSQGDPVHVIYVADGVGSRYDKGTEAILELDIEQRRGYARKACEILGCKPWFLNLPDQKLDAHPLLSICQYIEKVSRSIQPTVVYTHHAGDLNLDHQIVNRAVLTAFRPVPGQSVRAIYGMEIPSSTEWGIAPFMPQRFVGIADQFEKKLEALRCYKAEMRDFPHARSFETVEMLAKLRGAHVGLPMAEAFTVLREVER